MAKSELTESAKQEERRWKIESAASTLKEFAKLKRDKKLLKEARDFLKQEIADAKKVLKTT